MKQNYLLIIFIFAMNFHLLAQPIPKAASDAFLITRMAEKFHVQPRPLDQKFSADLYKKTLHKLDRYHYFFTQDDIEKLKVYQNTLNDEISKQKTDFLQLLFSLYSKRLSAVDTMAENICAHPFNFNIDESLPLAADSIAPANMAAIHKKLYLHLKYRVLDQLLDSENHFTKNSFLKNKTFDSLEIVYRNKTLKQFKRFTSQKTQSETSLQQDVCNIYCKSIAECYDPHSAYFPPVEKENFESEIGNTSYAFGIGVDEKVKNGIFIDKLEAGSPAFKSGLLNKGDQVISIQWEGKKAIDVTDATPREFSSLLDQDNHDKLNFVVKKADKSVRQVTLVKEKEDNADNKVKGFLLKGSKTVGYISLPDFYTTWDEKTNDNAGCANDVATEIIKLKEENINGLILDLRYNGGGSVREAVDLSGIFIDAGPIEQVKGNTEKVYTLKDINRGTVYDGPLIILVNGYSASASEIFAGTLQDYNRALIVGSTTYGKATAQSILPMDTTINMQDEASLNKQTSSYLKLTINKSFRITGATAQRNGVVPDIVLPDLLSLDQQREIDEPLSLIIAPIDANKYYHAYPPLPLSALKALAAKDLAKDSFFIQLNDYIKNYKKSAEEKSLSLKWPVAFEAMQEDDNDQPDMQEENDSTDVNFKVDNNAYEKKLIANDEDLKDADHDLEDFLLHDSYVKVSYDLLNAMQNHN